MFEFLQSNALSIVLAALLANAEILAMIPKVKSNSNFQLIYNGLKKFAGLLKLKI